MASLLRDRNMTTSLLDLGHRKFTVDTPSPYGLGCYQLQSYDDLSLGLYISAIDLEAMVYIIHIHVCLCNVDYTCGLCMFINPPHACTVSVTVVVLCMCVSVCQSVTTLAETHSFQRYIKVWYMLFSVFSLWIF